MKLARLDEHNQYMYHQAYDLYVSSFPEIERRDRKEHNRIMAKQNYHFDIIVEGTELFGIMLYWETESFIFLEHFATLPEVRNRGVGAKALDLLKGKGKTIILEIEDPVDELTKRRYNFYARNGFIMTEHFHIQAKYHLGCDDLMLKIMSYPYSISRNEYIAFQNYMTREIGILPQMNKEIVVRPLSYDDDLDTVARLIYLSDAFIYPYWFDCIEDGIKVIREMILLPTLYNIANIHVAELNGKIVAAVVAKEAPVIEHESDLEVAFGRANVPLDSRTHEIFENYYAKMNDGESGFYAANLAVDPEYRHRGIAATLLYEIVKDKPVSHLECVKANIGAWRVYQRLGFSIIEEYPGVFDVPCYRMVRNGD